ncbi:MAG: DUF4836 family protein [Microscillaceae bacterium]|nr:DUF4836 family protein [Microscillaceae bacterium]MDW8461487.1 DUF4836 family protein [Cytophagales bacterium]
MKKRNILQAFGFLLCLIFAFLYISCGKSPRYLKLIPADASFVIAINTTNIATKVVSWTDLFNSDLFKGFGNGEAKDKSSKVKDAGIDFLQTAYLFGNANMSDKSKNYVAVLFQLSDEAKFEQFAKNLDNKNSFRIETNEGVKYAISKEIVASWKDKTAIILSNLKKFNEEQSVALLKALRNTEEKNSLVNQNKQFADLQKESYDISFWLNLSDFNKLLKEGSREVPALGIFDLNMNNSYITSTLNFEKGKVIARTQYHCPAEIYQEMEKLFKKDMSATLIENLPVAKPLFWVSAGLDMKYIKEGLKSTGFDNMIDKQANTMLGLSLAQVLDIFTGEIALAGKEIKMGEETVSTINPETGEMDGYTVKKPTMNIVLALGVRNSKNIEKILKELSQGDMRLFQKREGVYVTPISANQNLYVISKDKVVYLTNEESIKNSIQKDDKKERIDTKIAALAKNSYFAWWIDMQEQNKVPNELLDEYGIPQTNPIESIGLISKPLKNNIIAFEGTLTLKNKSQNSLRTLLEFSKTLSKTDKKPKVLQ